MPDSRRPLVTGSIRVPKRFVEAAVHELTEFFRRFAADHDLGDDYFSHIVASCATSQVETTGDESLTEEQEAALTASRGTVVMPRPHPGFGIKLPE